MNWRVLSTGFCHPPGLGLLLLRTQCGAEGSKLAFMPHPSQALIHGRAQTHACSMGLTLEQKES